MQTQKFKFLVWALLVTLSFSGALAATCTGYSLGTYCVEACPAPGAVLEDGTTCNCNSEKCKLTCSNRLFQWILNARLVFMNTQYFNLEIFICMLPTFKL